jgi:hypothetical protein
MSFCCRSAAAGGSANISALHQPFGDLASVNVGAAGSGANISALHQPFSDLASVNVDAAAAP